ncbi:TRAP transporter substrate-binding protein, partial [Roseiarcus sp.]|uniref:TRAP transporter substrate-binding protein n=1 Tax=Roseiarcus sp. TaxID=1969460 RepID=UPI003F974FEB
MTSAFPPSLDLVHSGAKTFVAAISDTTDGGLTIAVQPPGAVGSPVDAMDAVAAGKADRAHTSLCYASTNNPAYLFGSGAPFGMNARQHGAWLKVGGGNELIDNLLAERGLIAMLMGSTGGQMAGWFRKELHSVADLAGMKVRIDGFAGRVLEMRGTTPVALPKDRILEALAQGSLDAFEGFAPYDDEKFRSVTDPAHLISSFAPYYYFPGWWKGEMQLHLLVSKQKFADLPKAYRAALRSAAALADNGVRAQYDAANPIALKRLARGGAGLRLFPQEILEAFFQATNELYAQLSQQDAKFKAIAESYMAFRSDEDLWWRVAEYSFDRFRESGSRCRIRA